MSNESIPSQLQVLNNKLEAKQNQLKPMLVVCNAYSQTVLNLYIFLVILKSINFLLFFVIY
jgi:hypothetical protein